jgi:hypothetical protein
MIQFLTDLVVPTEIEDLLGLTDSWFEISGSHGGENENLLGYKGVVS